MTQMQILCSLACCRRCAARIRFMCSGNRSSSSNKNNNSNNNKSRNLFRSSLMLLLLLLMSWRRSWLWILSMNFGEGKQQ